MTNLFTLFSLTCDAPRPWGVYFQDSASPQMEALVELHDNIMFYLVIILFGVAWILISIIRSYVSSKSLISDTYLNYGTLIELIWTITPALILILIAFPSFKLLYLMDEVTDPSLTVFVEGHQWYWSDQYPDFLNNDNEELEFGSYLVQGPLLSTGESSDDEIPGEDDVPELDFADNDSVIAECTHDNLHGFVASTQEDVDETKCDICRQPSFNEVGDLTLLCDNCHGIICDNCYDYSDSDSESESR